MRPTPLLPASKLFQVSSTVLPTPQIRPMPVTTTRLSKLLAAFRMFPNVVDRFLHAANILCILLRNLHVESFFKSHYQFCLVQRICAQVLHKRSARRDFTLFHTQLLHANLFHFLFNRRHMTAPSCRSNRLPSE